MRTDKLGAATQHTVRPTLTPGPWHLNRAIRGRLYVEADGPVLICDMQLEACVPATRGITEADARLIAAAPELLEALKWAMSWECLGQRWNLASDAERAMIDSARAAIAKAEGQV